MTERDRLSRLLSRGMELPEQRSERFKRAALKLGAAGLTLLSLWNGYTQDVTANKEAHAERSVQINDYKEANDDDSVNDVEVSNIDDINRAFVVFGGFDSYNSRLPARIIGVPFQEALGGEIWTVDYMNAPLDIEDITEKIEDKAEEGAEEGQRIDEVILIGASGGGAIATQVHERLTASNSLDVSANIQVLSTDGIDTLRDDMKGMAVFMGELGANVESLLYSTPARIVAESTINAANISFDSPERLIKTSSRAIDQTIKSLTRPDSPGMALRFEMLAAIANGKAEERIGNIGSAKDTILDTAFLYLGIEEPGWDHIVAEDTAGENICGYAHDNDIYCEKHDVRGAVHGRPDLAEDEYAETIKEASVELAEVIEENKAKRQEVIDRQNWRQLLR